jgi:plasmid maintenance system antidote protein VapI
MAKRPRASTDIETLMQLGNEARAEERALSMLGNELRAAISRAGLTRRQFADLLGVTEARVSQILAGNSLTIRSLARIANALGCELEIELCQHD